VLGSISDEALGFQGQGRGRALGVLAWHLVAAVREISKHAGLVVNGPTNDTPVPPMAAEIPAAYERAAASLAKAVEGSWFDGTLAVEDDVYGEPWPRGKTLFVLLCHEVHHRGQLTLLLRQAGLEVPEVYGPSGDP
jgi:uncharacterized damage-inducible protein DinB